ncbi:MAG TPA: aminotransferase DegT [Elusimicrobia bacterium]|nr:MAG: hypothetical protein A2040_03555 [Rhodocyclales bacterium GWA2_65_19]HAZ07892.1 aminotransferase DegT [Elusimicrobiota bacterium]
MKPPRTRPRPPLALSEPFLGGNEWRYVKECLDTGWVSTAGSFVTKFEKSFASYVGVPYAVAAVNGTAALHTALLAVGVKPGDEVIVPDLTFISPANAVRYCGADPVFIDAEPRTWQLDPEKTERFLVQECRREQGRCVDKRTGRRVSAIIPVHLLGLACDIEKIVETARRHNLKIVEDAAEAMGVRYRGRHVGTFGDAAAFSFNGNKVITSGGGGMLATSDPKLARYAAYLTTQAKDDAEEYFHAETGYNYRLNNILAALGLAQLEQLDGFIKKKRLIAAAYDKALCRVPGLVPMPRAPAHVAATYWLYTILLAEDATREERKAFIRRLGAVGVGSRCLWHNLSDLPPFKECRTFELEHSKRLYERSASLPSSVGLKKADLEFCIATVVSALHD